MYGTSFVKTQHLHYIMKLQKLAEKLLQPEKQLWL